MSSFALPLQPGPRPSSSAATLCRTRLGWVLGAAAIHGLLFALLASMPPMEVPASLPFPVELIPAETPRQPTSEKPAKPEPKPLSEKRPTPPAVQPMKRETTPTPAPTPSAVTAPTPSPTPAPSAAPAQESAPSRAAEPGSSPAQPRTDAAYLVPPAPAYPNLSKRLGETGRVYLRVHVLPSGQPDQVEVRTTSGFTRLDNAAVEAVRRARFVPRRVGGEAVDQWVLVPISFNLEN